MTYLQAANLLYREPTADQDADAILVGDVYEWTHPPIYVVDPRTRQATAALQCFRVVDADLHVQTVARGSWLPR